MFEFVNEIKLNSLLNIDTIVEDMFVDISVGENPKGERFLCLKESNYPDSVVKSINKEKNEVIITPIYRTVKCSNFYKNQIYPIHAKLYLKDGKITTQSDLQSDHFDAIVLIPPTQKTNPNILYFSFYNKSFSIF